MSAHARLSPSAAARWLRCPGSVDLCAALPDEGSAAADQGTVCHSMLARYLLGKGHPSALLDTNVSPRKGASWVLVTAEMVAWVLQAAHSMRELGWDEGQPRWTERRVGAGSAFGFPDDLWGTLDYAWLSGGVDEPLMLTVVDAKFGFERVEAVDNEQLLMYAVGLAQEADWPPTLYRLVIVQPRDDVPWREWLVTSKELHRWRDEHLDAVAAAAGGDKTLRPSDEACRWCRAAAGCPARQEEALALAQETFAPLAYPGGPGLEAVLDAADRVRKFLKAAEEHAAKLLAAGQPVPGWKLVESKKHRQWADEKEAVSALKMLGVAKGDIYEERLISPAQAEKLLSLPAKTIEKLAPRPKGDPVLARESDPRPALEPVFQPVSDNGRD